MGARLRRSQAAQAARSQWVQPLLVATHSLQPLRLTCDGQQTLNPPHKLRCTAQAPLRNESTGQRQTASTSCTPVDGQVHLGHLEVIADVHLCDRGQRRQRAVKAAPPLRAHRRLQDLQGGDGRGQEGAYVVDAPCACEGVVIQSSQACMGSAVWQAGGCGGTSSTAAASSPTDS